ncbi:hypothetical protein Tsp_02042, partial [Trichinella spiralis]
LITKERFESMSN